MQVKFITCDQLHALFVFQEFNNYVQIYILYNSLIVEAGRFRPPDLQDMLNFQYKIDQNRKYNANLTVQNRA